MNFFYDCFYTVNIFIFYYVLMVDGFYLLLLLFSLRQVIRYMRQVSFQELDSIRNSQLTPPISVIVPAYNEEKTIKDSLKSFLNLDYPEYEIVVVNDGSTDMTLEHLIHEFKMMPTSGLIRQMISTNPVKGVYRSIKFPQLVVIDKENGGKADALNAGINASSYPYFCGVDADSILEQNALLKTMRPFIKGEGNVVACGGIVRIANGCKVVNGRVFATGLPQNWVAAHQVVEYLRSFLTGRIGMSSLDSLIIISGAFGVFRKKEIIAIGGYNTHTVGEDMEIVIRLHKFLANERIQAKVLFVPDPVCWTEAPENLKILSRQRIRWHIGLIESLWKHKDCLFNPRYGMLGVIAMPYFLFVELLGPCVELLGFIFLPFGLYLHIINIPFAILFSLATLLFGVFLSMGAILLEEFSFRRYTRVLDFVKLVWFSVLENFWYRQVNAVWRTWAFIKFIKRDRSWGKMERKGFSQTHEQEINI